LLHLPSSNPLATCHISWAGGSRSDPAHARGRCRVLASLLPTTAPKDLRARAAALVDEGALYGYCDDALSGISLTAPARRLCRELKVLASIALRPAFTQDQVDAAGRAVAEDAAHPSSSWLQAAERQLRRKLLRTERLADSFTVDGLRSAHRQLATADNTLVVVAGDSIDDGDLEHLAELFSGALGGHRPKRVATPRRSEGVVLTDVEHGGWVGVGQSLHGATDAAPAALEVLQAVLVGPASAQASGRLVEGLRHGAQTYDVRCLHQPGSLFAILAAAEPASHRRVLDRISRELLRLSAGELPRRQLLSAQKQLVLQYALLTESPRHLTYFASRWIHATGALESWADLASSLAAVDADAVARVARRLVQAHAASAELPRPTNGPGVNDAPASR
ncbi:MAG: insulinase family protein, partial [Acidobacteriota bacterium]